LPVPDGGDETPSPANIEGDIVSIQKDIVVIQISKTNQKASVRLPNNEPIYTAFGGDGPASDLRVGQMAKVWFVGCKPAAKNVVPVAAYFEIFSKDPNDRP
jgi:hypothetical protein